jgi:hypothetical protein
MCWWGNSLPAQALLDRRCGWVWMDDSSAGGRCIGSVNIRETLNKIEKPARCFSDNEGTQAPSLPLSAAPARAWPP